MKKGRGSRGAVLVSPSQGGRCGGGWRAGLISLSPPGGRTRPIGVRSGGASPYGPSGGQGVGGACRSEGLVAGEHVPDRFGEAAGEVDLGDLGAALLADACFRALVAVAVDRCRAGVGCCFDEGPAEVAGSLLGERAAEVAFAGLVDAWAEARVAGQLARRCKAADVAELGSDGVGEHPADPGHGAGQGDVWVVGAQAAQLAFALVDLPVELVDQAQAGLDRALPGLGQIEPGEQLAAVDAEEVGDGAGLAVGEQDGVHTLLEAGAVAHEMQSPARPLALGAHARVGQPDRRHQLAPGELGQHPGVDAVGLAGKGRQPLHLLRIGDLDLPTRQLEPVVDEAGPVHRLDRRPDRSAVTSQTLAQTTQPVRVRRRGTDLDPHPLTVEQVKVETLATEIQTGVQHRSGPPLDSSRTTNRSLSPGEALLHGIPYHEREEGVDSCGIRRNQRASSPSPDATDRRALPSRATPVRPGPLRSTRMTAWRFNGWTTSASSWNPLIPRSRFSPSWASNSKGEPRSKETGQGA